MITVQQAIEHVRQHAHPLAPQDAELSRAAGLVLAGDVVSDVDSPPHDKALMDGYAVRSSDIEAAGTELGVLEEITAGDMPARVLTPGTASRIMTGAPLPRGADAVVMVEQTELVAGEALDGDPPGTARVRIIPAMVSCGANVLSQAAVVHQGETVLRTGHVIRPIEIGLLAEVGAKNISVHPRPRVAILSTGNELVPYKQTPSAGQIRNSNGPMLAAMVEGFHADAISLGIGRDDPAALRKLADVGLSYDVLLVSGGVSAGVKDLVPNVLDQAGVERVFHKVQLKPGKPVWFGLRNADDGRQTLVFGLPGNPVSSLVCCELLVRPALERLGGRPFLPAVARNGILVTPFHQRGGRPTYFPAFAQHAGIAPAMIEPLRWQGSADLRTLASANCLVRFPAGDRHYRTDESVEYYPI